MAQATVVAHEVPALTYAYNALEPYIDEQTMHLHHDKHHTAYVTKLNGAIEKHPELGSKSPEELLRNLSAVPEDVRTAVRNNGGGHVNHSMFWQIMGRRRRQPDRSDRDAINKTFGSFDAFKEKFETAGANQFGSGWAWLVRTRSGEFKVTSTPNQDTPSGRRVPGTGQRCLGTCLLSEVSEPPAGIPRRLVERGELGRGQQTPGPGNRILQITGVQLVFKSRRRGRLFCASCCLPALTRADKLVSLPTAR